eukprot:1437436-Pleurochrysis_carterae.AAC.1
MHFVAAFCCTAFARSASDLCESPGADESPPSAPLAASCLRTAGTQAAVEGVSTRSDVVLRCCRRAANRTAGHLIARTEARRAMGERASPLCGLGAA